MASIDANDNGPTTSRLRSFKTLSHPDAAPPQLLNGPIVRNISSTSATIEWITDEPSSSVIDLGNSSAYELDHIERGELLERHSISVVNLTPGTVYHYMLSSTDASNNRLTTDPRGTSAQSRDHTFTTLLTADTDPPIFLEGPVVFAQDQAAKAEWRTDEPARYELIFDTDPALGSDQREIIQGNNYVEQHSIDLTRLQRGTAYYYQLTAWDQAGNSSKAGTASTIRNKRAGKFAQPPGGAGSFITRPEPDTQFPVLLSQPSLAAKTATTLAVEWETDERADSFIEFGSGSSLDDITGSSNDVTRHRIVLTNLQPGGSYEYVVNSTDPSGNGATKSSRQVVTTALETDLSPPDITRDPNIVNSTDRTVTIEWSTDELSTSVVQYGLVTPTLRREDAELTREHRVTLTNLKPASKYTFRIESIDMSGNGPTQVDGLIFNTDSLPDLVPPMITSGPTITSLTLDKAKIAWDTDELADSFIDYGLSKNELYEVIGSAQDVTEHELTITNLEPATTYFYAIGSIDRANNGPVISTVDSFTTASSRDLTAPDMPASITGQSGSEAVLASWTASTVGDLAGYNLYRRSAGGSNFKIVASMLKDTTYVDEGLTNGVPYVYHVTAVDQASPPNESVPTTPIVLQPNIENVATAPTAVSAEVSGETVDLLVSNATPYAERSILTYTFQVSTSDQFTDVVARGGRIVEGSSNKTMWSFTRPLEPGAEYFWRARANDGVFDGQWMTPAVFVAPQQVQETDSNIATILGDFDFDGIVGFTDFFLFAEHFGLQTDNQDNQFDLDRDRRVGFSDFFIFTDQFTSTSDPDDTSAPISENPDDTFEPDTNVSTPTSDWEPPGGASPPRVNQRQRKQHRTMKLIHVGSEAITESNLHILSFTGTSAVVGIDIECANELTGYGIILQHAPGIVARLDDEHAPSTHSFLQGVLRSEPERTWLGVHGLSGQSVEHTHHPLSFTVEFPASALGSDLNIEALWIIDQDRQVSRKKSAGSVKLLPQHYRLEAPYPNPFNPSVHLRYTIPMPGRVTVDIYNILGQRIQRLTDEFKQAGLYTAHWNGQYATGQPAASGVYFIRLQSGSFNATRKVLMVK